MAFKIILLAFAAFGGLYLLFVLLLALNQRGMIYHPEQTRSDPAEADVPEMVPVPLKAEDGWPVGGWYAPPKQSGNPTVVFFHGNSGTIASRAFKARSLLDAGFGVFLAEYRGYGGMPGRPSEKGLYADGRAVVQWLLSRGVPASKIVLYGESLGAGVAMEMAGLMDPMLVVLECPFTSIPDLAPPYVVPPLPHLLISDRFDNLSKMAGLRVPLLIVHGERDETVPVEMARRLLAATSTEAKEGLFIPTAHHNDLWDHGAGEKVIDFIARRGQ
ncbi:alpha/beta hydrolase [Paramagnetospirillum marisnigri]|uniref:Alpha/beta hydrolase n=1 Tax=Paramagnetospirillum marisnigri TaxID=1285242 RepID=A0A178MJC4_9PROT|nr:alpha/beta hydrolase [Paramagnetospirillum marisnigri]OAN48155.1 alpha/beta hydrolase [Paramagnetospirillum marisnigri]